MPDHSVLANFTDEDPSDFTSLVDACGKFIDAWLDAGGEPTDDAILGFYGLWAQSLDLKGMPDLAMQKRRFYAGAYPAFIEYREEVRNTLNARRD